MKLRTRKILFMIAALLSGLSTLMPFLIVHHEGMTQRGFPVETETTIKFMHCYYGIAILVAAILVIIFVLMEKRIGYTIATVSGVILAIWGIFDMMNYKIIENGQIDIKGAFYSPLNGLKYNSILEVRNGAGYYLLIGSIIFLLVMMLINFAKGDEDDE